MTRKQFARLRMYAAVDNVLTLFNTIATTVPALVAFQTELQANIAALLHNAEIQDTADAGIATDKEQKRIVLCRLAPTMAGQVKAWAENTGNTLLAEQMDITFTGLQRLKDGILAERCQNIHNTANTNLAALANYGVTAAKLTDLQTAIDNYENSNPGPRAAEVAISAATVAVKQLHKDTTSLLDKRMDLLMENFRTTEPEFYNQYTLAREIQDAATQFTKLTGTVTDVNATAVSGVKVEVVGKAYNTLTGADGSYDLRITVPGSYSIKYSKSGFANKLIDNVEIKLGEETVRDVEMSA